MKQISLQKQILDRIKTQHVHPVPKGFFRARDYILWGLLGVLVAALSLGSSMVIFLIRGIDRHLFAKLGLTIPQKVFYSVPYFWVIATVVVAIIALLSFRQTRKGYRLGNRQLVIAGTIAAVAFGSVIYAFNISKYVDRAAIENIPLYSAIVPFNTNGWFDPDRGLLSGSVKTKTSDNTFTIRDQNFDLWTVIGDNVSFLPEGFVFRTGDHVKIIGKKTGAFQFTAYEVRPYENELRKDQSSTTAPLQ